MNIKHVLSNNNNDYRMNNELKQSKIPLVTMVWINRFETIEIDEDKNIEMIQIDCSLGNSKKTPLQ